MELGMTIGWTSTYNFSPNICLWTYDLTRLLHEPVHAQCSLTIIWSVSCGFRVYRQDLTTQTPAIPTSSIQPNSSQALLN
eukprot:3459343-Amphidinium_carterae.1